jgi:hypothetical protein
VRRRIEDVESKDLAGLIRKRNSRAQHKRLADLILPLVTQQALQDLLGDSIPEDIERTLIRQAIRCREKIRGRMARYDKPGRWPLILDAKCINAFPLDIVTDQRACFCIGKRCPRRDIGNVTLSCCTQ